jgi:DNA-binding Lrp family transcriptional regulator
MEVELDIVDRRILDLLQAEVPLTPHPFALIGQRAGGVDEREVLERITRLKAGPRRIIRQISAIFDSAALGYQGSLVAAKIDPARLDDAAAVISSHPGVSHNYRREHEFNVWYTVAVPPDGRLSLEGTIDLLHRLSGAISTRMLPTLKRYKIGVKLDLSGEGSPAEAAAHCYEFAGRTPELTEAERDIIRVTQQDLPIVARPFDVWAQEADVTLAELLQSIDRFEQQGRMRRFAAVLRHREAGFAANGMGTWIVPAGGEDTFGAAAAQFREVSHCYCRPTYPDWPYNLFTMVHAPSPRACEEVLSRISQRTGVREYACLYSTHEYKKVRVKYFTPDIADWEAQVLGSTPESPDPGQQLHRRDPLSLQR